MNHYKENNCRICQKVFCCKKCRQQHETLVHKVLTDCNICLYGKIYFRRDLPEDLIRHIRKEHWPLYCIICKYSFGSLDELLDQNLCRLDYKNQNFEKSPYTPIQYQNENICRFPKVHQLSSNPAIFSNLATSTPLQLDENNLPTKSHSAEVLTSVEFLDCASIKRKVTFCETSISETYKKEENKLAIEEKFEDQNMVTPSSGNNSTVFYSAKQYQHQNTPIYRDDKNMKIICTENEHKIEFSPVDNLAGNKPFLGINFTPVVTKLKKRQINVVLPIVAKDNVELPTNFNSTTLSIFKSEENICKTPENKFESHELLKLDINNADYLRTNDMNGILTEASTNTPSGIWSSVSKFVNTVANVVQEFSGTNYKLKTSLKRSILEDDSLEGPCIKRYKLTEIKCRPPIRQLALQYLENSEDSQYGYGYGYSLIDSKKTFVDKATQTEDFS